MELLPCLKNENRWLSLIFSLMITTSFFATAPNTDIAASVIPSSAFVLRHLNQFSGSLETQLPPLADAPSSPPAADPVKPTSEQLQKLITDTKTHGSNADFKIIITDKLGLTQADGTSPIFKEDTFGDYDNAKFRHGFIKLDNNAGYLLIKDEVTVWHFYYLDNYLVLKTLPNGQSNLVDFFPDTNTVADSDASQAGANLDAEWKFWIRVINEGF